VEGRKTGLTAWDEDVPGCDGKRWLLKKEKFANFILSSSQNETYREASVKKTDMEIG
jgi:hypothetical protein